LLGVVGAAAMAGGCAGGGLRVEQVRCEYRIWPLGIDATQPRLSWSMTSPQRGAVQSAYRVLVASGRDEISRDEGDVWDSGRVASDQSTQVAYAGKPLASGRPYYCKVRVWDGAGRASPWSETFGWSMGLLDAADWKGQWIGRDEPDAAKDETKPAAPITKANWIWYPGESGAERAPVATRYFRRTLTIPAGRRIERAVCLMAGDNEFTLWVNGHQAARGYSFKQVDTVDIASLLEPGENVVAAVVSNAGDAPNPAGLIGAVQVTFDEGEPLVVVTDASWKASQAATPGWETRKFDDAHWAAAELLAPFGEGPWGELATPEDEHRTLPARMLRKEFEARGGVMRATAYICGLGYYELYLNGQKVGDHVLDPVLSQYDKRVYYVTYDVMEALRTGTNAVGVMLGNGRFYAPRRNVPFKTNTYGYPKVLLQLAIEYGDGSTQRVVTDGSWKLTTDGPIRENNDYDGEVYDARMEMPGWSEPGFDDSAWETAAVVEAPGGVLCAQMMEPQRVTMTLRPVRMTKLEPGTWIFDMGQNMVGWARLTIEAERGWRVRMRFAEVLSDDGTLNMANLRSCKARDVYICKGEGTEVYEPRFTYHGFRYVEVTGVPDEPNAMTIEGRVVHTDLERVGEFACSNETINQIYQNVIWGIRGNVRSVPTDCPQRDERHGWLGDIANESKAESYDFNVASFFAKWLNDIQTAQLDNGNLPDVAPPFWEMYTDNMTWPAAYFIIPDWYYDQYGDARILAEHYDSMCAFLDYMGRFLKDGIMPKDTYGDWCVPPEDPSLIHSRDPARKTDGALLGTAYYYHDLRLMARCATVLRRAADAHQFNQAAEKVKRAFNARFFDAKKNLYSNGTQTSSVLPLAFGLVPAGHEKAVFANLVDNIMNRCGGHLATGLIGGQWLMRVLTDGGRPDVAYTIATQRTYPSWGYMAEHGATTIWELWNGDTADPGMNSHNHLMLVGDLGIWLYEDIAGLAPDPAAPGMRHLVMRPTPVGDLTWARAMHRSLRGPIASAWKIADGMFAWKVIVPPNTTATLFVPTDEPGQVTEGGVALKDAAGVTLLGRDQGRAVLRVASGSYEFQAPYRGPQ
jgi:alpha-L-rhamnosidase